MKKIILTIMAAIVAVGIASAQDVAAAVETYNKGAESLTMGDKTTALEHFQKALTLAQACGAEGEEVVTNCKNAIPGVILSIGKEFYNNKDFDSALAKFAEAVKVAKEYGVTDVATEAETLIPQTEIAKNLSLANDAFEAKKVDEALENYKKVLAADTTNSVAAIRVIQCLSMTGNLDEAKTYLGKAEAAGQGDNAKKILGTSYLKNSATSLKTGKYADAVANAIASTEFDENPQAYLVAGQASTKIGKESDAIKYFQKYLELAPSAKNAGKIALTVGALSQKAGDKATAIEYYKKALSLGENTQAYIDALSK